MINSINPLLLFHANAVRTQRGGDVKIANSTQYIAQIMLW